MVDLGDPRTMAWTATERETRPTFWPAPIYSWSSQWSEMLGGASSGDAAQAERGEEAGEGEREREAGHGSPRHPTKPPKLFKTTVGGDLDGIVDLSALINLSGFWM